MRKFGLTVAAAALATGLVGTAPQTADAASAAHPPQGDYSFTGFFGTFDRGELQRGLQVYTQICAGCHGLDLIRFRELGMLGYSDEQIAEFAAEFQVPDLDEWGEPTTRPAIPADSFPAPFPNDIAAAAANGGKAPPDLSLIVKSRAHGLGSIGLNFLDMLQGGEFATGTDYIAGLIGSGYVDGAPTLEQKMNCLPQTAGESQEDYVARLEAFEIPDGTHFNQWFPGCSIGMAQPLYGDDVEYEDGTEATVEQMSHDVAVFLTWASEPYMEDRKQTGIKVVLFLLVFTGILIAVKRQTWAGVKKH
ncbi:MAG: cytochrome c1 [Alphaproteobacteria bacterium]